ncbi:MAG: hypothetical protein ACLTBD_02475 [Clostridia bacterium]
MNNGYAEIKNCIIEDNQAYSKGAVKNGSYDATKPDIRYGGQSRHEGTMVMEKVSIKKQRGKGKRGRWNSKQLGSWKPWEHDHQKQQHP